jgi:hypothetical protein
MDESNPGKQKAKPFGTEGISITSKYPEAQVIDDA